VTNRLFLGGLLLMCALVGVALLASSRTIYCRMDSMTAIALTPGDAGPQWTVTCNTPVTRVVLVGQH
jgi:hypothetical protein